MTTIDDRVKIPLSDGITLSARVWFAEGSGPFPAILEYHPYPKRYITAERDEIGHGYFSKQGFVSLRVDMRGSGDSEGLLSDEYTDQAREDAAEVINWIANQAWCTGAVGMYGLSWGGFNGIQMATSAPRALKAVAVAGATDNRFICDTHFKGGVIASEHFGWAATLLSFLTRPPDPEIVGSNWKEMWVSRLEALQWILPKWLAHPSNDSYWQRGFPAENQNGLEIPTLIAAGVNDVYVNAALRMVKKQPDLVKAVIGPWGHHYPHRGLPGPSINWLHHCVQWFNYYLKGEDNPSINEPPLRLYITQSYTPDGISEGMRKGRWISFEHADIDNSPCLVFGLSDNNQLSANWPEGELKINTSPTMGTAGGEFMPMGWGVDLPTDQKEDDKDCLLFDTEPLEQSVEVIGSPRLCVTLRIKDPEAFLVARLCDVAPDGSSSRISMVAHQLSTNGGVDDHQILKPDKTYAIELELDGIAHQFAEGHRIRLALSNTYWPMLWPGNYSDGLVLITDGSHFKLPVPDNHQPYHGFEEGDGHSPHKTTKLSVPVFDRSLTVDTETSYRISDAAARTCFDDHGMETFSKTTRNYRINESNPKHARMTAERHIEFSRGSWHVASNLEASFVSDASKITSQVTLTVTHNEEVIFERRYHSEDKRF